MIFREKAGLFPALKKSGRDLVPRSEVRSGPAFRPGKHSLAQRQKFMPARGKIFKSGERRGERADERTGCFAGQAVRGPALTSRSAPKGCRAVPGKEAREGPPGRKDQVQKGSEKPFFCMKRPEKKKAGGEAVPVRPLPESPAQALRRVFSWILSGTTDRPRPPRPAVQALGAKRGPLFPAPSGRAVQAFRGVKFSKMMLSIRSFF